MIGAVLVVFEQNAHPDQVDAAIDAIRQLRGVAGIRTVYSDAGQEIRDIRAARDDVRTHIAERARAVGGV